jgi:hypothetical protein
MVRPASNVPADWNDHDDAPDEASQLRLDDWAASLTHPDAMEPQQPFRPPPRPPQVTRPKQGNGPGAQRRPPPVSGRRITVAASVFAVSGVFGATLFLYQTRPALLELRSTAVLIEAALGFVIVLLLALTVLRVMAMDTGRPGGRDHALALPDHGALSGELEVVAMQMEEIVERSDMVEGRLAAIASAIEDAARQNLATLDAVASAVEAEKTRLEAAVAASEANLHRVLEAAQLLCNVVQTAGDSVWSAASENDLTIDAKTRYMAERLRYDLRIVVEEALVDFEQRARVTAQTINRR